MRELVALPLGSDITARQWKVLELQLGAATQRLSARLKQARSVYFDSKRDLPSAQQLNSSLGELELALSRTYSFFDTYMDVLTQRHTPELGQLLAGCDALACSALQRDHPALRGIEPPLVFCDRGFGASIIREDVSLPDGSPNPMPVIQIPYSKLREKPNLTSILHEAGHQALQHLGLRKALPKAFRAALTRAGASRQLADLFALWASEIGPDFWTFCASGLAAAGGLREILALPPEHVFRISWTDPHPPPYLRVLLAFECCRKQWGRGPWDDWQTEWLELYPLTRTTPGTRKLLEQGANVLPLLAHTLLTAKFRTLNGRTISDLWDLAELAPANLERVARGASTGCLKLTGLSPCAHLGVFRILKDRNVLRERELDRLMTRWLLQLGARRS